MQRDIAVVLVHGVGAVDRRAMLDHYATSLAQIRPAWNLSGTVTERHQINTCETELKKGVAGGRSFILGDIYWGDIATVGEGFLDKVWGILLNMLGMRYIAAAALLGLPAVGSIAMTFVWLIAAVDIPLNLFTFLYAILILYLSPLLTNYVSSPLATATILLVAASVAGIASGIALWKKTQTIHEERPLVPAAIGGWLTVSVIAAVFAAASFLAPDVVLDSARRMIAAYGDFLKIMPWKGFGDYGICGVTDKGDCITPAGVQLASFSVAQRPTLFAEAILSIFLLLALGTTWVNACRAPPSQAAASADKLRAVTFGVATIHAIWFIFGGLLLFVLPADSTTSYALRESIFDAEKSWNGAVYLAVWFEVLPTALFFCGVLLFAALAFAWRKQAVKSAAASWSQPLQANEPQNQAPPIIGPRLYVSNWFLWLALCIAVAIPIFILATSLFKAAGGTIREYREISAFWTVSLILLSTLGLAIFGARFRVGLKSFADFIDHFVTPPTYPVRKRIADRFRDTVDYITGPTVRGGDAKGLHLCVLAHSQGTVITIDRLREGYFKHLFESGRIEELTIVTFGSPIHQIYERFSLGEYAFLRSGQLTTQLAGGPVRWHNVYRGDDFIGTCIPQFAPDFPINTSASPGGGHTTYWYRDVFQIFSGILPD